MRFFTSLSVATVLLVSGACDAGPKSNGTATTGKVVVSGKADIGGPFTLVNTEGETVTEADILGKPQLIYFGFSYCPDVCPLALQQMGAALAQIDPKGEVYRPIMVSVDPERDTPDSLKLYITANGFPKGLMGLTGTPEQVEAAKKSYKVYAQKREDAGSAAEYTVDHSDLIYLMDKDGNFVDVFLPGRTVPDMVGRLKLFQNTGK